MSNVAGSLYSPGPWAGPVPSPTCARRARIPRGGSAMADRVFLEPIDLDRARALSSLLARGRSGEPEGFLGNLIQDLQRRGAASPVNGLAGERADQDVESDPPLGVGHALEVAGDQEGDGA